MSGLNWADRGDVESADDIGRTKQTLTIMKTLRWLITANLALFVIGSSALHAAEGWVEYRARPGGSKMTIEGTSTLGAWQSESRIVGGTVQVGPELAENPAAIQPGKVDIKANVFIPVRSLKSMKADGTAYSSAMDDIMYEKLRMAENPNIEYRLTSLVAKENGSSANGGVPLEAEGELVVGGVTQKLTMPVTMKVLDAKRLEFIGTVTTKMTDFEIEPPAPKVALGAIKTGDEVKLSFEWVVARR
jgi:polyisoprenoid-binding protein YceI